MPLRRGANNLREAQGIKRRLYNEKGYKGGELRRRGEKSNGGSV